MMGRRCYRKADSAAIRASIELRPSATIPPMAESDRIFSYEQALETFPSVRDLTGAAVREIEALVNRVQSRQEAEQRKDELETAVNGIIQSWAAEISSLGCEVKGLWLVDWDSGDGYYCWKYPEQSIAHFHAYDDGFAGRMPIN